MDITVSTFGLVTPTSTGVDGGLDVSFELTLPIPTYRVDLDGGRLVSTDDDGHRCDIGALTELCPEIAACDRSPIGHDALRSEGGRLLLEVVHHDGYGSAPRREEHDVGPDAHVIIGKATLCRRQHDGAWSAWGEPDHWLDGRTLAKLRGLDRGDFREVLEAIEDACRIACDEYAREAA